MPSKIVQEANGVGGGDGHEEEFLAEKFLENGNFLAGDEKQEEKDEGNDVLCGVGSWRPACLQSFTRPAVFTVIYCFTMMLMGMPNAYFYAITTTIEKVFNMNSRITGVILIGNDISQILIGFLVGYVGSKTSRPLWMSFGLFMCSATCFMYAFNHRLWDGVSGRSFELEERQSKAVRPSYDLCATSINGTKSTNGEICLDDDEGNLLSSITVPVVLFFMGQFLAGVGNLAITSLGLSYSDDFSKKKNTPMNISFILSMRVFGAFFGFMVASACLRLNIDLNFDTKMSPKDPRWLGAWWLGFVIFGIALALVACIVIFLPRKLPARYYQQVPTSDKSIKIEEILDEEKELTLKDMMQTISRLLRNKSCVYLLTAESVMILYMGASQIYSSRYTELMFGQSASRSSLLIGMFSICTMVVSILIGAMLLKKFKPTAKTLLRFNCLMRITQGLLICCQMFLSCSQVEYANIGIDTNNHRLTVESACSLGCECPMVFQPICMNNGTNYLSPCFAGCRSHLFNDSKSTFGGCSCVSNSSLSFGHSQQDDFDFTATNGICPSEPCSSIRIFLVLTVIINFMASALFPAQGLMLLRCVDKRDKSMAMAMKAIFFCLIGFLPGPIIYGSVFYSCCLLHETKKCGSVEGNCWIYDVQLLRFRFLGTSALIVSVSIVFSVLLYFQVRRRDFSLFEHEEDEKKVSKNDASELQIKKILSS